MVQDWIVYHRGLKMKKKLLPNIDHFSDLLFTVLPAKVAQNSVSIMWI